MDARMNEVYWAQYRVATDGLVSLVGQEHVGPVSTVANVQTPAFGAGTGWRAYAELRDRYPTLRVDDGMLPRAQEVAKLGIAEFQAGRVTDAGNAQPVYLRDQVVSTR